MWSSDFLSHLNHPALICFVLGLLSRFLGASFTFPQAIRDFLSFFLLFTIGVKGGLALRGQEGLSLLGPIFFIVFNGILSAFFSFFLLKTFTSFPIVDVAALSAHFSSISIVTFLAGLHFLEKKGIFFEPYLSLLAVFLEFPGILMSLFLGQFFSKKKDLNWRLEIHKTLTSAPPILISIGFLLAFFTESSELFVLSDGLIVLFQVVLLFFLLDVGFMAGEKVLIYLHLLPKVVFWALVIPLFLGSWGVFVGQMFHFSLGGSALLGVMFSSVSYIAAPASVRLMLPEANPGLYLTASVGIALPFNLILGLPLYLFLSEKLAAF